MDCLTFQDSLSDYLEGLIEPRARAECAAHRLICGECRELYTDVRGALQATSALRSFDADPKGLSDRIIAHTTTGEMLSCGEFDKLLERYFDGVILAPTFQTFQSHFKYCLKCRRLLDGIEEAIAMLQEAKESEVEVPGSLHERIVAATTGRDSSLGWVGWLERAKTSFVNYVGNYISPQLAVAAMIIALISLLVISRFGSVSNMTTTAEQQVESLVTQGQRKITGAGAMARTGFERVSYGVNSFLFSGAVTTPSDSNPESAPKAQAPRSDHSPDPDHSSNQGQANPEPGSRDRSER